MSHAIQVPRLAKGQGYKGPEHYGCFNTGMASCIFHSRTGRYVVGPEIPCRDAMRAGLTLVEHKRVHGEGRRRVWIFKGRKAAVAKFMALCGAQILENDGWTLELVLPAEADDPVLWRGRVVLFDPRENPAFAI